MKDTATTPAAPPEGAPPAVIDLGDAATLTKGSDNSGVESKQTPYDA
ncbi:albusnodin family lasso peptide [Streptomyces sp. NPDC008265]